MLRLSTALLFALLTGCAAQSYVDARAQMQQGLAATVTPTKGLIFGERCGGGGFMIGSASDTQLQLVPGWDKEQRFFFLSLPAGEYTLSTVGSSHGAHTGAPPFRFRAVAGKATYVGSFYPGWGRVWDHHCEKEWGQAVGVKPYSRSALLGNTITYDVYLLNRGDIVARGIEGAFPNLKLEAFEVNLAK